MKTALQKGLTIVTIATFFIFLGRGLQLVIWDAPFRAFLWDESLLKGIVENWFNTSWRDYVTSRKTDTNIQLFTKICGFVLVVASVITIVIKKTLKKRLFIIIYLSVFILSLIAFSEFKDKFKQLPQFFEASLQLGTPLVFLLIMSSTKKMKGIIFISKILVAITFAAHGLYALGVYNVPVHFVEMTINILGVTESVAVNLLQIAGILDIILVIALFVPNQKVVVIALCYAFIWGMVTAFARPIFNFRTHYNPIQSISSIHQFLYRICHGLVPLAIIYFINHRQKIKNEIN